jgi:hypothetical protein
MHWTYRSITGQTISNHIMSNLRALSPEVCLQGSTWSDLQSIHEADYQIGVWQRELSPELQHEAADLVQKELEPFRFSGTLDQLAKELPQYFILSSSSLSTSLQDDLFQLANQFRALSGAGEIRLFFGRVTGDMCRRFHTDIVSLRLLCTYYGPGTLWAPPGIVNEKYLNRGDNVQMISDEAGIQQLAVGEVGLLKGALHEQSRFGAVLHRSPSIEEFGLARLLLRVDTPSVLD